MSNILYNKIIDQAIYDYYIINLKKLRFFEIFHFEVRPFLTKLGG